MGLTSRTLSWVLIASVAPLASAQAGLTVIGDHGGQSARAYYAPIAGAGIDEQHAYSARAEAMSRGPVKEADLLPVQSNRLTPGAVTARKLTLPSGMTPFFIIGADRMSLRWIKQRAARLRDLHAVGLVVNVGSAAQLTQLRAVGGGLVMRPVAGNDIARRLDLAHYPVLITPKGVQQ